MAYTELFCKTSGSNLNGGGVAAGTEPTDAALYTATNGNWNGTSIYTPTDGSTPASTVTVGDMASVYIDGATLAVYVARVVTVAAGVNGAITLSTTAFSGTAPTSSATLRSIKVGGAWKGPNGAINFPFGFITAALKNASGYIPRVNFKNGTSYAVTAALAHNLAGPVRFQGYTSTPGDLGKATIDGGATGASYLLLLVTGSYNEFVDLVFQNNGNTGNSQGVQIGPPAFGLFFKRCVFSNFRRNGVNSGNLVGLTVFQECEAFACNANNTAGSGGFIVQNAQLIRCVSHDNTTSNSIGFATTGGSLGSTCIDCIAHRNGRSGFETSTVTECLFVLKNCDSYRNGSYGLRFAHGGAASTFVESCNFLRNGISGIASLFSGGTRNVYGSIINCGFGSGTEANVSGDIVDVDPGVEVVGSITYPADVTPWVDPANGDFRINLAEAMGTGRGTFTQTASGYAGTIGYPDIGAAQHLEDTMTPDDLLDFPDGVETDMTLREALRLILSAAAGKLSGAEGPVTVIRDVNDVKNRITADVDETGRTNVILDVS